MGNFGGQLTSRCMLVKGKRTELHVRSIREEFGGSVQAVTNHLMFLSELFRSLLLSFSPTLDEHNPDIPEWREDVGRVVRTALSQVHHVSVLLRSLLQPEGLQVAFMAINLSSLSAVLRWQSQIFGIFFVDMQLFFFLTLLS